MRRTKDSSNMDRTKSGHGVSRRAFLRGAAGIAATGLAGLRPAEAASVPYKQVRQWDDTADVVIVGYGAAGGSAALAAHDDGARVVILEKMDVPGGNSGVCHGGMVIPADVSEAADYYRRLSFGTVDEDMLAGFAEAMVGVPDLLRRLGARPNIGARTPDFPSLRKAKIPAFRFNPTGRDGFAFLARLVGKRNIRVMVKTAAANLVTVPETGEVAGVRALSEGREIYIRARRGIVLACGGYENNPEMFGYYNHPGVSGYVFPLGTPGNTGDGLKMAAAAGACLWHTAPLQWASFCAKAPSRHFGVAVAERIPWNPATGRFLFADRYGRRFMRETKRIYHTRDPLEILRFDHDRAEYPHLPAYLVFDEAHRRAGPVSRKPSEPVGYAEVHQVYDWSRDNAAEVAKGWIVKGDTIAELAGRCGIDANGLEETVGRFNRDAEAGKDTEFGRAPQSMEPLAAPPFYALELGLALVNTQGGPKRNRHGQVLDPDGRPVPRLYAAGELGSFFGFLYQVGSNYPEAWASGRIAGRHAASLSPLPG